jgi:hypothetical protein
MIKTILRLQLIETFSPGLPFWQGCLLPKSSWHLQKHNCNWKKTRSLTDRMSADEHRIYPSLVRLMPAWLSDYFYLVKIGRIRNEEDANAYWSKFSRADKVA